MELGRRFLQILLLSVLIGCGDRDINKKTNPSEIDSKFESYDHYFLDKKNVVESGKIFQYPESLTISRIMFQIYGHGKLSEVNLNQSIANFECEEKAEFKLQPIVSWDIQKADFLIPAFCCHDDSLILRSMPRAYRGDKPDASIYDRNSGTVYNIDTRFFNDILSIIQLSDNRLFLIFDGGVQYGETRYSVKYSIIKLK